MDAVTLLASKLAAPSASPPVPYAPPPAAASRPPRHMTPGGYLQMRRMHAGLTVDEVARVLGFVPGDIAASKFGHAVAATLLRRLEAAPAPDLRTQVLLGRLPNAFPFDPMIYGQLVDLAADPGAELPVPVVCSRCACSWFDPCEHKQLGPCALVGLAPDAPTGTVRVCTHCDVREAFASAVASSDAATTMAANDG